MAAKRPEGQPDGGGEDEEDDGQGERRPHARPRRA